MKHALKYLIFFYSLWMGIFFVQQAQSEEIQSAHSTATVVDKYVSRTQPNAWQLIKKGTSKNQVENKIGKPYYRTEHHPRFKNYKEVWLYTKRNVENKLIKEEQIEDSVTKWPGTLRVRQATHCAVSNFFVLFRKNNVARIVKDDSGKKHGPCEIITTKAFIPNPEKKRTRITTLH